MVFVYAAGPISGKTYEESELWRIKLRSLLPASIGVASPLRAKQYLKSEGVLEQSYAQHPLSTDRGIMTRDRHDCTSCDVLAVNLLGTTRVSIGTVMEIAWADNERIPIVLIIEESGNVHDHPMVREAVGFRVTSVEDAAQIVQAILAPQIVA